MEEATIALEAELSAGVWTDLIADSLLGAGPLHGEYGIRGTGPLDLIASTGILRFILDNGASNSAGKPGYYTPGHVDQRSGFDESTKVRTKFTYGGTSYYKMLARISDVAPSAGLFREARTTVTALDWMDQAAAQKIAQLGIQTNKRGEELLALVLADMPIQPRATSFDTGIETLARFFDTDSDEKMSPMSLMAKMARNELGGRIYVMGDTAGGETLRFEHRRRRILTATAFATLDQTMDELEIEYSRKAVYNVVRARVYPKEIDAVAVVIYTLQSPIPISTGQSVTLVLPFRDPATARALSASDVTWPPAAADFKFGANEGDYGELNAALTFPSYTVGGNSARVTITNAGSVPGWLNKLEVWGKGIKAYDPLTYEARDQASIDDRGETVLTWELEQHDNLLKAEALAGFKLLEWKQPRKVPQRVRFLANKSSALMLAFLQGEPGSRVTLKESLTATDADYFINAVGFDVEPGGLIWCEWTVEPAYSLPIWIIGVSQIGVTPVECVPVL